MKVGWEGVDIDLEGCSGGKGARSRSRSRRRGCTGVGGELPHAVWVGGWVSVWILCASVCRPGLGPERDRDLADMRAYDCNSGSTEASALNPAAALRKEPPDRVSYIAFHPILTAAGCEWPPLRADSEKSSLRFRLTVGRLAALPIPFL